MDVGYWPDNLFTHLKKGGDFLAWGGEIVNREPEGRHTTTQMGSGHFPSEGIKKSAFIRNLRYVTADGSEKDVKYAGTSVTRPECYDLQFDADKTGAWGDLHILRRSWIFTSVQVIANKHTRT